MSEFPIPTFTDSDARALGKLMALPKSTLADLAVPVGFVANKAGTHLPSEILASLYKEGMLYVGDIIAFYEYTGLQQNSVAAYLGLNRKAGSVFRDIVDLPRLHQQVGENFMARWPTPSAPFPGPAGLSLLRLSQQVGRMGRVPDPVSAAAEVSSAFKGSAQASVSKPVIAFTLQNSQSLGGWYANRPDDRSVRMLATPVGFALRRVLSRKLMLKLHNKRIEFVGDIFGSGYALNTSAKNRTRLKEALAEIGLRNYLLKDGLPGWPARNGDLNRRFALLQLAIKISRTGNIDPAVIDAKPAPASPRPRDRSKKFAPGD